MAALAAAATCFITGETLPVGLLPQLSASLHRSLTASGLIVTVYAVVVVVASAPLTHLTRNIPRRLLLTGVLATFVLGTLATAAAPSYGAVLAARIVTALAQAVYWSVAPVAAAGLLPAQSRARAVSGVFSGSAIGIVVGVPAGTWLGQQAGWWVPFVVLAAAGLLTAVATARLFPAARPADSHSATGAAPDRGRYRVVVAATILTVTGFYASFTYISAFLTRVSGVGHHQVALVLLAGGIATTAGLLTGASFHARRPHVALVAPVALVVVALAGLWGLGTAAGAAVAFQALESAGFGAFVVAAQTSVLVYAPRSADLATAWFAASFNIGIAAGPVIGGLVLNGAGLRDTPLVAALIAACGLLVMLGLRTNANHPTCVAVEG